MEYLRRSGSHQHREEGFPKAILPTAGLLIIAYAKVAAASSYRESIIVKIMISDSIRGGKGPL